MRHLIVVLIISFACFAINSALQVKPKIVNGFTAKQGQFPYFAFLAIQHSASEVGGCGASLLSDEWLVTAAHCLEGAKTVVVYLGKSQLNNSSEPGHVVIVVEKSHFYVHPWYFGPIAFNDIALIHLPQKVEFSPYIQPVRLPTTDVSENVDVVAIGHGATGDKQHVSLQLHYAHLETISRSACYKVFPIVFGRDSVICAYSEQTEAYQSVCQGDSGGPLVSVVDGTLIGITDFVHKSGCEQGIPQGFTNVYSYLSWIKKYTESDSSNSSHKTAVNSTMAVLLCFLLCLKSHLIPIYD